MKFFKKSDLIILLIIIAISISAWVVYKSVFSKKSAKAEIYYNDQLVETVELNTGVDKTFSIPQDKDVIFHLFKDGSIGFEKSDCPDKICIKAGKLKTVGETAACIPNKIFLKIVPEGGRDNNDLDGISGQ
jgi:hypothetical protein